LAEGAVDARVAEDEHLASDQLRREQQQPGGCKCQQGAPKRPWAGGPGFLTHTWSIAGPRFPGPPRTAAASFPLAYCTSVQYGSQACGSRSKPYPRRRGCACAGTHATRPGVLPATRPCAVNLSTKPCPCAPTSMAARSPPWRSSAGDASTASPASTPA